MLFVKLCFFRNRHFAIIAIFAIHFTTLPPGGGVAAATKQAAGFSVVFGASAALVFTLHGGSQGPGPGRFPMQGRGSTD